MIKGVHFVKIATKNPWPRWYVYAWRGGPCIKKWDSRIKPLLNKNEVRAILDAREKMQCENPKVDPTILRSLIRAWRSQDPGRPSSPEWQRLAAGTRKTWGSALDRIEEKWGETPIEVWDDPRMTGKVVAWRDSRAATPRAADIGITVLKALLNFGRLRGQVKFNAAAGVPTLYRNGQRSEIIWTDEDMLLIAAKAAEMDCDHVTDGMRLAALTGLRRADLVTLKWSNINQFAIEKRALKRSGGKTRRMMMPRIPALDQLLDELRHRFRKAGVDTVLVNSSGAAWSADGYGGSFNRVRDAADIAHVDEATGLRTRKHLHDVRGTFCTRLIVECGLSDAEAAEIMGWAPDRVNQIRKIYVDQSEIITAMGVRMRKLK